MYDNFFSYYYNILLLLTLFEAVVLCFTTRVNVGDKRIIWPRLVCVVMIALSFAVLLGYRPGSTDFGDTLLYQGAYINQDLRFNGEPVLDIISDLCHYAHLSVEAYLSIVAVLYIGLPLLWIYTETNKYWYCLLFIVGSFSFMGYGINGIRNGLALSFILLSFKYVKDKAILKIPFALCLILGVLTHKSAILPVFCLLCSIYCVKNIRTSIIIWLLAIPTSFIMGVEISSVFSLFDYDERFNSYLYGSLSHKFRWDFIAYSIVPILLALYVKHRRISVDRRYQIIANTYILCNALWIIIIKANFSNRFAYLSWFLYPYVIMYPILKFRIFKNTNIALGIILLLYYAFTYTMFLIGK